MPALSFDPYTVILIAMTVAIVLAVIMILIRLTRKTYPGFGLWAVGITFFAAGGFFLTLRNIIPDIFTIVLANVLILTAALCFWEGTRRFHGKEVHKIFFGAIVVSYAMFETYYAFIISDIVMRFTVTSFIMAAIYALVALELLRNAPSDSPFIYKFTAGLFVLYSGFMLVRGFIIEIYPPSHNLLAPSFLQTTTFLLAMFLGIAWTFSFVMLNSEKLESDLKKAQDQLQKMATTDFLTCIPNNRFFLQEGEREILRTRRYDAALSVLMFDIDRFKKINDKHGHAAGDKVLAAFTEICKKHLRDVDIFGRLGGDEFAILSPETDIKGAKMLAKRLLATINKNRIEIEDKNLKITTSIGVAELLPKDNDLKPLLKRADEAMYEAKRKGRNQIVVAPEHKQKIKYPRRK